MMDRGRILFVDDDVLMQWTMTDVLIEAGFSVVSVCRATDAVKLMRNDRAFDLLLTDVTLPDDFSGLELAALWHVVQPGRPIVYATQASRAFLGRLEDHEAFVQKPCGGDDLMTAIEEVLDEAQRHAPPVASPCHAPWFH